MNNKKNLDKKIFLLIIFILILVSLAFIFFKKPQETRADWWDDNWHYRKSIDITYAGSENLTEYQVLIDAFDTSTLITDGKMQADCDDIRFTSLHGQMLDYAIVGATCNTTDTEIWVKVDSIPASDVTIQMYYGNNTAGSYQSYEKTFSYSEEKVVGYVLNDDATAMQVISLEGDNTITHNGSTLALSEGGTGTFSSLSTYGSVSAKKPFDMNTAGDYDTIVPVSWAGVEFSYANRTSIYETFFVMVSPWGTATVQIYVNGVQCGADRTVTSTGLAVIDCGGASGDAIRISSDIPILVNKTSDTDDPYPMYPSTRGPVYGWDSQTVNVGSASTTADYRWIDSDDTVETDPADLSADSRAAIAASGGSYYNSEAVKVYATSGAVGVSTTGDANGGDGTTYVPRTYFGPKFGAAFDVDYVAVLSDQETTCSTYNLSGVLQNTATLESTNTEVFGLPATSFGTGDSNLYIGSGFWVECDKPVYVVYEYVTYEKNAWSYPMMAQYTYPAPAVASPATEETAESPIGYWSFDEGYGTTAQDESSSNNDGTITGATWQDESMCVSGKCLYFDGDDDYLNMSSPDLLDNLNTFTICTWMKMLSMTDDPRIYAKDDGNGTNGKTLLVDNAEPTQLEFRFGFSTTDGIWNTADNTVVYSDWQHVCVSYDGTSDANDPVFYVDGKTVSFTETQTPSGTADSDASYSVYIGNRPDLARDFDGYLDEYKIYPYVLTADQVKQDYNAGTAGAKNISGTAVSMGGKSDSWMTDGLVGYWKMDESAWSGVTDEVVDSSGNGNHGTGQSSISTAPGIFGQGGSFDGTDDYIQTTSDELKTADDFSIVVWFKADSTAYAKHMIWEGVATENGWGNTVPEMHLSLGDYDGTSRNDYLTFFMGTRNDGFSSESIQIRTAFTDTTSWHQAIVVAKNINSSPAAYLYLDGELAGSDTGTATEMSRGSWDTNLRMGRPGTSERYYDGQMDEVRIYNRALQPNEVMDLYNWAPGPVGHWKIDEKSGTSVYDVSGNDNTGTMNNMDSSDWVKGVYGSALDFDGSNDYVNIPNDDAFNFDYDDKFTLATWVKTTTQGKDFFGKMGASSPYRGYNITFENDKIRFHLINTWSSNALAVQSATGVCDGEWHHVAVAYDGSADVSGVDIYIDGKLDGKSTVYNSLSATTQSTDSLKFGLRRTGGTPFDGQIDDFRIYNYDRTAEQIVEDMNAGHPAGGSPISSKLGHWKFDEGFGTTAYDSGFAGNDGTISGATWSNDGKFGKALSFDGSDDYVDLGSDASVDDLGPLTFSAWIYPLSLGEGSRGRILNKASSDGGDNGFFFNISSDNGEVNSFQFQHDCSGDNVMRTTAGGNVSLNEWQHIVLTWDGGLDYTGIRMYVNGKETEYGFERTGTGSVNTNASQTLLVGNSIGGTRTFDGLIDEVKIYNYELNEEEIKLDYNQGKANVLGSIGTESDGVTPSFSASREYCVPGDTSTCDPPVAEWKFDEKTGTSAYDTSANSNDGTLTNMDASTDWVRGKIGSALEFDGLVGNNDYVACGSDSSIDDIFNGGATISTWIYVNGLNSNLAYIYNKIDGSSDYIALFYIDNTNGYIYFKQDFSGADGAWYFNPNAKLNTWYYLTLVYDSSDSVNDPIFYLNGRPQTVFEALTPSGSYQPDATGNWEIGGRAAGSRTFPGLIDNFRVYDYERTPAQIAWEYNRGKPIGHWKFDEGQGSIAHDYTDNKNNGTITDATWATGNWGGALDFDGTNDWVNLGDVDIYDGQSAVTASAWIYFDSLGYVSIVRKDGSFTPFQVYANNLQFAVWASNLSIYQFQDVDLSTGEWHHYIIRWANDNNGGYPELYIDGKFVSSSPTRVSGSTSSGVITNSSVDMMFGTTESGDEDFNGKLDDVRIYPYLLNDYQVKQVYNEGAGIKIE